MSSVSSQSSLRCQASRGRCVERVEPCCLINSDSQNALARHLKRVVSRRDEQSGIWALDILPVLFSYCCTHWLQCFCICPLIFFDVVDNTVCTAVRDRSWDLMRHSQTTRQWWSVGPQKLWNSLIFPAVVSYLAVGHNDGWTEKFSCLLSFSAVAPTPWGTGGHVPPPTFTNGLSRGGPWVEEQQTRN